MSQTKEHVDVITKEELVKQLGFVQVVNVLEPKWYSLGIIAGSKKIPLAELGTRLSELDQSKPVVTYCASVECSASSEAAKQLVAKGFKVKAYEGGVKEWKEAGLPMDEVAAKAKSSGCQCD